MPRALAASTTDSPSSSISALIKLPGWDGFFIGIGVHLRESGRFEPVFWLSGPCLLGSHSVNKTQRPFNPSRWVGALSILLVGFVIALAVAAALAPALLPAGDRVNAESRSVAAGAIFVGSYLALAIGRIPGLSIDRAGISLVGASLMVASGALSLEEAYQAVD